MNKNSEAQASESLCPDKSVCGSCGWSHIPYDKQLAQKLSDINGSFKLHESPLICETITPSPKTSHYRNRMDFVINFEGHVGLRQKGKWWRVIDNHCCFISDEKIERCFFIVRDWVQQAGLTFFDRKKHHGFLRYAVLRCTKGGELLLNLVTSSPEGADEETLRSEIESLVQRPEFDHTVWSINTTTSDVSFGEIIQPIKGAGYLSETIGDYSFEIAPHAFFQTNSHAAEILLETVTSYAKLAGGTRALDLYCGAGFFSFALREHIGEVLGVEINEEAVAAANRNAEINSAPDIEFHAAKSEDFAWEQFGADLILIDPPRSGLHDRALKRLLEYRPKSLLYVSCNYKQLARESLQILEHYHLRSIEALDMFPHTPHVEVISLFERR